MSKSNYLNEKQEWQNNQRKVGKPKEKSYAIIVSVIIVIITGIAIQQYYELNVTNLASLKQEISKAFQQVLIYSRYYIKNKVIHFKAFSSNFLRT